MKRPQALSHLLTAGLIACAVFGSMNASARSLDEIMQSKTLIVGVNPNLPPLGVYDEKNEISGFDVSVARKIADTVRTLGLQRFDLKYANGTLGHERLMRSVELYGTRVIPLVRDMLASS